MARYRSHSLEFKRHIAQDFLEGRAGLHELSRRHNLSRNLIRLWVQRFEAGELINDLADAERIAEYEAKIAELERKVGQLTMEVEFLKKARQLAPAYSDGNLSIVSGPRASRSRGDAES
jgi:transposase